MENDKSANPTSSPTSPTSPASNTAYDDALRTMLTDCSRLALPVFNEAFGKSYKGNESIFVYSNELFMEGIDAPGTRIITDCNVAVVPAVQTSSFSFYDVKSQEDFEKLLSAPNVDRYHAECESRPYDKTVFIRFFKYDSSIAAHSIISSEDVTDVYFPESLLIYLRSASTKEHTHILRLHAGDAVLERKIQIIHISDYTVDDLFDKKLYFFIPFILFNDEKKFSDYENDESKYNNLINTYSTIQSRLIKAEDDKLLTTFERRTICDMSLLVMRKLTQKHVTIQKGLEAVMGGKVLDHEAKDILREGRHEGQLEERERMVADIMDRFGIRSLADLVASSKLPESSVKRIAEARGYTLV